MDSARPGPTVLLLLDAFRHDYLDSNTTPFLWRCSREGTYYREVEPGPGFCERAEILSGLRGLDTGFFAAIGFDPEGSEYRSSPTLRALSLADAAIAWIGERLPPAIGPRIHRRLRQKVNAYFRRRGIVMSSYFIPYAWLPYFALTEDRIDHRRADAFPGPSLLSLLTAAGRRYCYETFSALGFASPYASDEERLDAILEDASADPKDFYLAYIAAPDAAGHRFGPNAPEMVRVLRTLDAELERFVMRMNAAHPRTRFVFLGDHGMHAVTRRFDAEQELRRRLAAAHLQLDRDVIYFLDSTLVRVWAMSSRARDTLAQVLNTSAEFRSYGVWIDAAAAARYELPWPDRRYGDFLWAAHPGVLVVPDFFNGRVRTHGMHGYVTPSRDSRGCCIRWGAGIPAVEHSAIRLNSIYGLLRDDLGL